MIRKPVLLMPNKIVNKKEIVTVRINAWKKCSPNVTRFSFGQFVELDAFTCILKKCLIQKTIYLHS